MPADKPEYHGQIDGRFGTRVCGWFCRQGEDRALSLELLINDQVVATFVAEIERDDLARVGFGSGRHGFMSPEVLQYTSPDDIIKVKLAGTDVEVSGSGHPLSSYKQLGSDQPHMTPRTIASNAEFAGVRVDTIAEVRDLQTFRISSSASLTVEPPGTMRMPPSRVVNRAPDGYRVSAPFRIGAGGHLPTSLAFPKMTLTTLEDAYCLPFAPPLLPTQRKIITDFLIPWAPAKCPWFHRTDSGIYETDVAVNMDDTPYELDTAFYMDHTISEHFGHFLGDCLCRMYAWSIIREIYGDVKLIIGSRTQIDFQDHFLSAAGVDAKDIVKIRGLARCKRLLLATQSLGVEQYASPTSARLWSTIRDRSTRRDITLPDRIYLTRSGVPTRRLVNETRVEQIFARHGFTIVRPELLSVQQQIALVANALLIAGPGGSGMFNLAFQGRLRSAFILMWEQRLNLTEMLLCAGRSCDIWYHLGKDEIFEGRPTGHSWRVDPVELESNVADWVANSIS